MSQNSFAKYVVLLVAETLLLLVACTTPSQEVYEPAANGSDESATSVATSLSVDEDALDVDAQWYANRFNTSHEEALHRLRLQGAIGKLGARLTEQEPETFAGLWIENEPDYKVVVAFTGNGEEILQPYIQGQPYEAYVEVRTHRHALTELESAQQEGIAIANRLDLSVGGGIDIKKNRATLVVGNPELFLEKVRAAGITLPDTIEVLPLDAANLTDTNQGVLSTHTLPDGSVVYFPQQPPQIVYLEGGPYEGTLMLDEAGCLRLRWDKMQPLILWRHDLALRVADEEIEILDDEGKTLAQVGQPIEVGGGFSDNVPVDIPEMPLAACPGPYLQLGSISEDTS